MHRLLLLPVSVLLGCSSTSSGDSADEVGSSEDGESGEDESDSETDEGESSDSDSDSGTASEGESDSGTASEGESDSSETTGDGEGADYREPGPYAVGASSGSMQLGSCELDYGVFEPDTLASETAVLLAHGFMRSIDDMAPTAEHIASWGVRVYTVPLCTNTFNIDHQLNGEALAELGQALEPSGAIYAGFSAGGLAAWIAAASDPSAVAYVGLDAVDNAGLAATAAAGVVAPIRGVIAEPGQCNTDNNFLPVYASKPVAPVIRVVGAQHFDFETDGCEMGDIGCSFCAPNGPQTRATTLGLVTAAILLESGADSGGLTWWEPGGTWFDQLVRDGQIQLLP